MRKASFLVAVSLLMLITFSGCMKTVFSGSRSSHQSKFEMEYSVLTKTETHEMKLNEGTSVKAVIENKSGRLDILVTGSDGKELYRSDNASSMKFTLKIPKTDTYTFTVKGDKAKGSVSFVASN